MPRVNWQGSEFNASIVEQLPNGNYKMMALTRAPRVEPGTIIEVSPSEIIQFQVGNATFLGPGALQATVAAPTAGLMPPVPQAPLNLLPPQTGQNAANAPLPTGNLPLLSPSAVQPPTRTAMAASATPAPAAHFKGLVDGLRTDIQTAVAQAQALKVRGASSIDAFNAAKAGLAAVYDELDAATTEINGALLEPGSNGAPAGAALGNSSGTS